MKTYVIETVIRIGDRNPHWDLVRATNPEEALSIARKQSCWADWVIESMKVTGTMEPL